MYVYTWGMVLFLGRLDATLRRRARLDATRGKGLLEARQLSRRYCGRMPSP
jgi:hypothetical protein